MHSPPGSAGEASRPDQPIHLRNATLLYGALLATRKDEMTAASDPRSEPEIDEALEQSFPASDSPLWMLGETRGVAVEETPGPICSSKYRHAGLLRAITRIS